MKKSPKNTRIVEEIREAVRGKVAYTAVVTKKGYFLGVAQFGSSGYSLVRTPPFWTYEAAQAAARKENERMGLTDLEAAIIVADTMRPSMPPHDDYEVAEVTIHHSGQAKSMGQVSKRTRERIGQGIKKYSGKKS